VRAREEDERGDRATRLPGAGSGPGGGTAAGDHAGDGGGGVGEGAARCDVGGCGGEVGDEPGGDLLPVPEQGGPLGGGGGGGGSDGGAAAARNRGAGAGSGGGALQCAPRFVDHGRAPHDCAGELCWRPFAESFAGGEGAGSGGGPGL